MFTPFDRLVKAVWKTISSPYRTLGVAEEIDIKPWHPDFWAAPGPPYPPWMGLLARMAGRHLIVGESETGYLQEEELRQSVLEVQMAWETWLHDPRNPTPGRYHPPPEGPLVGACLLLIAERVTDSILARVLKPEWLERLEAGLWLYNDRFLVYIVSLEDLELREDTVFVHLLGRSSKGVAAATALMTHSVPEARHYGERIWKEMEVMLLEEPIQGEDPADRARIVQVVEELERHIKEQAWKEGEKAGWREGEQRARSEPRWGTEADPPLTIRAALPAYLREEVLGIRLAQLCHQRPVGLLEQDVPARAQTLEGIAGALDDVASVIELRLRGRVRG